MVLVKLVLWLTVYPLIFAQYMLTSVYGWVTFLFNSPVDVWNIVSRNVEEAMVEE
jgi:hypothetical protein